MRVPEIARSRFVVGVLAAVAGGTLALWIAGATDWRDVVLVLVTGAVTLVATEAAGAREARRRAEDRRHAEAHEALTGELELERQWLELTMAHVTQVVTVDLRLRQGHGAAASALSKEGPGPLDVASVPDLTFLADADLHLRFTAAMIDSHDGLLAYGRGEETRGSAAVVAGLAALVADVAVMMRVQQRRLARRERPLRLQLSDEDRSRHLLDLQRISEQTEASHEQGPVE